MITFIFCLIVVAAVKNEYSKHGRPFRARATVFVNTTLVLLLITGLIFPLALFYIPVALRTVMLTRLE